MTWDGRAPEAGWWWLMRKGDSPIAAYWTGKGWHLVGGIAAITPREMAWHYTLGPRCTPPAPVPQDAFERGWKAGIEAAARVVMAVQDWDGQDYYCDACKGGAVYPDREMVAADIRSLTPPEDVS